MLLLELEPPFDKRAVQLARRRMAKRWHPDLAPAGEQPEHERHLKAINEAADQLERMAESSRGGRISRSAVRASAAAARRRARRRGAEPTRPSSARGRGGREPKHDPFGSRVPDHSVVHRYARCMSYPEWGVGTVEGIYFTGDTTEGDGDRPGAGRTAGTNGSSGAAAGGSTYDVRPVGAGEVQPRHPHGAGGEHALRGLLQARPRGGADGALHGRGAAGDG